MAGAGPHGPSALLVFVVVAEHLLCISPELILGFPDLPGLRATDNPGVQLSDPSPHLALVQDRDQK